MSGDLKDPGRSLPIGTFCAVGISILVYFGVAVRFGASLPLEVLSSDHAAMKRVAWLAPLIGGGVVAATLSSAMASYLGAPRILQSLSGDRIFPFLLPFARGFGPSNNPRRGVILATFIALATILPGNLNVAARVVSMFFLISYRLLNYATFYEARSASPSFMPTFRWFDHRLSLLGFLGCLGIMLAIDIAASIVAVSLLFAIHQYLSRTVGHARWADRRRSYKLQQVRNHLIAASSEPEHPRDWRPQVLARESERKEENLRAILEKYQIEAAPKAVKDFPSEIIVNESADSSLVMLSFRLSGRRITAFSGGNFEELFPPLPVTAMVLAAQDVDLDAEPEEGPAGEVALAEDILEGARRKAEAR